jgi:hypothetical protein
MQSMADIPWNQFHTWDIYVYSDGKIENFASVMAWKMQNSILDWKYVDPKWMKASKRISMPIFSFTSVFSPAYTYENHHDYSIINASANGEKLKEG